MKINPSQSRQTGSSLLEVLIAVFILAFGLLGIAGMQISSLRSAQSSLERSQAVFLTHAILDAMRANMNNDSGTPSDLSALKVKTNYTSDICLNFDTDAASLSTGDTLATEDLKWWLEYLKKNLGKDACGQVECDDNLCTVTIKWDDSRGEVNKTAAGSGDVVVKNRSIL
jgi:type IV pilus assembly protein PilV